ncbi:MAG: reverse transcriptase/maturase family protein [Roseiarcus sp.]
MRVSPLLSRLVRRAPPPPSPKSTRLRQPAAADAFGVPALERAFLRVRANGGGAGGDGVTLARFDRARAQTLAALSAALATGVYRPGPLRRVGLRKRGGGRRPLAIPCVVDRVVQTAWLSALAPTLEARMHPSSFAYRSGRGVDDAVAAARAHVASGRAYVARVDIQDFFDRIPHARLFAELPAWIADKRFLDLARTWVRTAAPAGRGLPQGSPISPALANVYLDPLDRAMAAEGLVAVRYADDIAVFCHSASEGRAALERLGDLLSARGLELNVDKSRVVAAHAADFLGKRLAPRRLRLGERLGRLLRRLFSGRRERNMETA